MLSFENNIIHVQVRKFSPVQKCLLWNTDRENKENGTLILTEYFFY
jgi:hypothetical protein